MSMLNLSYTLHRLVVIALLSLTATFSVKASEEHALQSMKNVEDYFLAGDVDKAIAEIFIFSKTLENHPHFWEAARFLKRSSDLTPEQLEILTCRATADDLIFGKFLFFLDSYFYEPPSCEHNTEANKRLAIRIVKELKVLTKRSPSLAYWFVQPHRTGIANLGIEKSEKQAFNFALVCAQSDANRSDKGWCQNWVGVFYGRGTGVQRDFNKALFFYEQAHINGDIWAPANIAESYEEGEGVKPDFEVALGWYEKSLALGNTSAHLDIGRFYENGYVSEPDYRRAARHYRQAIQNDADNKPVAILSLAGLIERRQIDGSLIEALDLYELATQKDTTFEITEIGSLENNYQSIAKAKFNALKRRLDRESEQLTERIVSGDYYALLIGSDDYQFLKPLETPIRDIKAVGKILAKNYGFTNIYLENPSREDILKTLNQLRKTLFETDNLLIYYAGHGAIDEEAEFGFWQPVEAEADADYNWIPTDRITRTLRGFKSKNVMVVSDSCYSGTMLRSGSSVIPNYGDLSGVQALIEKRTRMAISSGGLEPVTDSLAGAKNSVFANQFILSLEGAGSVVSATDLFSGLQTGVVGVSTRLGITQTPEIAPLYESGHEGGDFFFVRISRN
jgi:uncharacterized protein